MRNVWKSAAFALVVLLGVAFGGVGATKADSAPEKPKAEPKTEAKKLDLPWSLDDIKKSMKVGATAKYKITSNFGGTETVNLYLQEITEVTDKGYKSKNTYMDKDGKNLGEPTTEEKTWESFGEDMKFTDADTKISEGKVKVTAGEFDCKIYTQTKEENGGKQVMVFYFPKDKAGHIAKVTMEATDGEGKATGSMSYELVEAK